MNSYLPAILVALVAIGLTLAQDLRPGLDLYHTWQYAAVMAIAAVILARSAWSARTGSDGAAGRRVAIGVAGALTIALGGLISGLIGPDTITVDGSPGTVTPVPDLQAAAFFSSADPAAIARGDATVVLRKRGAEPIPVPAGGRLFLGTSVVYLSSRPAAYIVARDLRGNRLTVTQPTNATFLSPVLLFPQNQPLRDKTYPLDTFGVPALHRIVRALYFSADEAQAFNHLESRQPALVLSVNDDNGKTIGLTVAPSGREVAVGDLRVTATLGTFPQIVVASAPHPALLAIGLLLFIGGVGAAFVPPKRSRIALAAFALTVLSTASALPRATLAQTGAAGTLRIALTQEPGTLNPVVGTLAVETDIAALLFSGLTRYDEKGTQIPDLAERVPTRANGDIAADGRSITYHLVRNARWHDGVPVTSEDVKFTFEALTSPKNNVVAREPYDEMERVETPDPYTVRIVLKRPWAPAIQGFSNRNDGSIVPAHLLAKLNDLNHADFNAAPIGSGPYKLVAWHRGSDMVFEANPAYFRGPPKIARIIVEFLSNDNTMMIALRTHAVDVADTLNISTYANLGNVPGMLPVINAKSYWEHLTFNTARAPLDDRRVRLALCYGFDVREIYAKVSHGLGVLGPTQMNPVTPWYNRKLDYYPFDPKRAAELLNAAGWRLGPDGTRVRDGKRLEITLISTSGNITREQTMVLLQQRWQAIGVDVTVKTYPPSTIFAQAANGGPFYGGKFDVALSAFIYQIPDPSTLNFNSADRIPPGGNNLAFYRNAELTKLEYAAAETFVDSDRKRIYDQIQAIMLRDVPYYTIRWAAVIDMRGTDLDGVKPTIVNSTFWNIADWQLRR